MIGGLAVGKVMDKIGSKNFSLINVLFVTLTYLLVFINLNQLQYASLTFLMCFMFGVFDAFINIHSDKVLGHEFESNSEPFCVFNVLVGFSVFVFQMI